MSDLDKFLDLLAEGLQPGERLVGNAFAGDPAPGEETARGRWNTYGLKRRDDGSWTMPGNDRVNRYVGVAAFRQAEDGTWRRKKDLFAAGCALMVDDVGDTSEGNPSVKVDWSALDGWKPTALIETSNGNFQCWYVLKEPCRDPVVFELLSSEFVRVRCGGKDPGMLSVSRVGRTPESTNGKKKHSGWQVEVHHLDGPRYTPEDLAAIWGLDLNPPVKRARPHIDNAEAASRKDHFYRLLAMLEESGMVKRRANRGGWIQVTCINVDNHSGRADSGTAIAEPSEANGWTGAYDCKHGSCAGIGWREFTQFIDDQITEHLAATNAASADLEFEDFQ